MQHIRRLLAAFLILSAVPTVAALGTAQAYCVSSTQGYVDIVMPYGKEHSSLTCDGDHYYSAVLTDSNLNDGIAVAVWVIGVNNGKVWTRRAMTSQSQPLLVFSFTDNDSSSFIKICQGASMTNCSPSFANSGY